MPEHICKPILRAHQSTGAQIEPTVEKGWRLSIPPGSAKNYRLAQLDDYQLRPHRKFYWQPPLTLDLRARVSSADVPGTWGFGFWNDPFSVSLGLKGAARRLPVLPNAAWVFHAAPPNYLALRDDHPATGLLASVFSSAGIRPLLLAPAMIALPLLVWRTSARLLRRAARWVVNESAASLQVDAAQWHTYHLELHQKRVQFKVDGVEQFESPFSPRGLLGLVIWIDNQFAAFPPDGRLRFGTLACDHENWLEIADLEVVQL